MLDLTFFEGSTAGVDRFERLPPPVLDRTCSEGFIAGIDRFERLRPLWLDRAFLQGSALAGPRDRRRWLKLSNSPRMMRCSYKDQISMTWRKTTPARLVGNMFPKQVSTADLHKPPKLSSTTPWKAQSSFKTKYRPWPATFVDTMCGSFMTMRLLQLVVKV